MTMPEMKICVAVSPLYCFFYVTFPYWACFPNPNLAVLNNIRYLGDGPNQFAGACGSLPEPAKKWYAEARYNYEDVSIPFHFYAGRVFLPAK